MEPRAGKTIGGAWVLDTLLGEGGMGQVWSGTAVATGERVALKLMRTDATEYRARFEREAELGASIVHPNVRRIHGAVDWDGPPVMVMELLEGRSLGDVLVPDQAMSLGDAATVLAQVVSAVGAMHQAGVVHRDLKPDNLFLVGGSLERVKVLDFGIAKLADGEARDDANAPTQTGTPIGTTRFMAPEQLLGEPTADDRVDVWALGVIAYLLLSGVHPTAAENVGQVMKKILMGDFPPLGSVAPSLPTELSLVVSRALSASPEARVPLLEMRQAFAPYARVDPPGFGPPKARRTGSTTERIVPQTAQGAHNLPRAATTFVGRAGMLRDIRAHLRPGALVTLMGAGGSGKTRLAIEASRALTGTFTGGVWFVDLGRVADEDRVEAAFASALPSSGGASSLEERIGELASKGPTLLLVDNCEHLVEKVASVVDGLLGSCSALAILATSREALGVVGEEAFTVDPLDVPPTGELSESPERLFGFDSVALFVDRAKLADRGFSPTGEDASAIARICRKLDGLPLAIELAAARVRVLGVSELSRRITDHLELLSGGARTSAPRHKTLRAAIAWSAELLKRDEQRVHRALGVFEGSFGLDAACAVAGSAWGRGDDDAITLDIVSRLVEKSLVVVERRTGAPRFRLLETVRAFAREELERCGELDARRDRHAAFYVAQAERWGRDGIESMDVAEAEIDDCLAADRWVWEGPSGPAKSLTLAVGLERYLQLRGLYDLGRTWTLRALAHRDALPRPLLVRGLCTTAGLYIFSGSPLLAEPLAREALAIAEREEDPVLAGLAHGIVGLVADRSNDLASAEQSYLAALACHRASGDDGRASAALNNLGDIAFGRGDLALALDRQMQALAHVRKTRDDYIGPIITSAIALLSARLGHLDAARAHLADSVKTTKETRAQRAGADALDAAAHVAERSGDGARALRWHAASEALRARIQAPTDDYYAALHREVLDVVRATFGEEKSREASSAGALLELPVALDEVLQWLGTKAAAT